MYNNPCFRMKTKIRVVLFSSLSLFLIFVTTFRVLWNANHPDIPLIFNQRNSPLHEVIVSDELLGRCWICLRVVVVYFFLLAGGTTLWRDWDQWVQRDGTLYTEAQSSSLKTGLIGSCCRELDRRSVRVGSLDTASKIWYAELLLN